MTTKQLLQSPQSAAEAVVQVLKEAGIDAVFGIAGGHAGHIWAALEKYQDCIRTVLVREESLGSAMAEVYGRLTGKPGVLIGQGPWILGNGLLGTIEAQLSSSPMLLLTDFSDTPELSLHGPYQSGRGDYGGWDARLSFKGVTKQVFEAHHPAAAVHATQLAIKHAMAGQPGPVAVLFSISAFTGQVSPEDSPRLYSTSAYLSRKSKHVDPEAIQDAAAALGQAKRPVIIAGNGVRIGQAYSALHNIAQSLNIPVVTSPSGKGVFAESHGLALGLYGTFGHPAANACVGESDLILAVGTKLSASDTAYENPSLIDPRRQVLIQLDIESLNASWSFPADHVVIGEAAIALEALREAAVGFDGHGIERVKAYRKPYLHQESAQFEDPTIPMSPPRLIAEMQHVLPSNAIVCCDAGENRIFMMRYYTTREAGGFLQAAGAGPMGYAIPAAMGAKLVHPERPVVAVCGDGGFSMSMNGLMTAIEANIPIITVIFNNQMLGWSTHIRGPFAAQFHDFDHAAIAQAMGCHGVKVNTPQELAAALREALIAEVPTVIDARISSELSYKSLIASFTDAPDLEGVKKEVGVAD
ncbi:thiamine pyrophosphate-binding protein [Pollutimonas nitritireducens]|nr:thiamine pyrophosphate-binding protein [Pollutimonas nitritireducens]